MHARDCFKGLVVSLYSVAPGDGYPAASTAASVPGPSLSLTCMAQPCHDHRHIPSQAWTSLPLSRSSSIRCTSSCFLSWSSRKWPNHISKILLTAINKWRFCCGLLRIWWWNQYCEILCFNQNCFPGVENMNEFQITYLLNYWFVSAVQLLSHVWFFVILWTAACQASLSFTISLSLFKLMSIESVILSNHLVLHCSLLLPSIFPIIRVFSNELALLISWPKYQSFNFSISLSKEYSGLISFRVDWLYLLAIQGTLMSLLHHHSSKASILQHSAFFNGPTFTFIHDYWKNHSFDYMALCWQSNISAF